jgi:Bacteriophage head to tail connecting protein
MAETGQTCETRYDNLASDRLTFLDRARRCSELTIPTLVPPQAHSKSTIYYTPWQGIGARGVNNLASKLLLSLLPPNSPFFRLVVDDFTVDQLAGKPGGKAIVDAGLAKIERAVQSEIEGNGFRSPIFLALKHLIVAGNILLYLPKDGGVRVHRLDSYVVKRDVMGNVLDAIALDEISPSALTPKQRELLDSTTQPDEVKGDRKDDKNEKPGDDNDADSAERTVKLYTRFYRYAPDGAEARWRMYQEINGTFVPGSAGSWPIDKAPFMALRWSPVDGEDYGRSYVEEYLGDLISLEGLSKAIVQASAVAAKVVYLLNPNGVTRQDKLTKAESGDVIIGRKDDVQSLQSEKQADMQIAHQAAQTLTERLSQAFLMNSSVQRQAERVTAEEVRFMASELEDSLGGVYSILSQEFQLPFVIRIMDRMTKQKKLPPLPAGVVKPAIVTGLEALGRGHDLNKYLTLMQALEPLGPQVIAQFMNADDYISRVATAIGIDPDGLVKTQADIDQEQQQAQQQQMASTAQDAIKNAAPHIVKAISDKSARMDQAAQDAQKPPAQG